jgi:hypothetical protein
MRGLLCSCGITSTPEDGHDTAERRRKMFGNRKCFDKDGEIQHDVMSIVSIGGMGILPRTSTVCISLELLPMAMYSV